MHNKSEFTIGVTVCVSFSPFQTFLAVISIHELVCQYWMIHTEEKAQRNLPVSTAAYFLLHVFNNKKNIRQYKTLKNEAFIKNILTSVAQMLHVNVIHAGSRSGAWCLISVSSYSPHGSSHVISHVQKMKNTLSMSLVPSEHGFSSECFTDAEWVCMAVSVYSISSLSHVT